MTNTTSNSYAVIQQMFGVIAKSECLCKCSPEYDEFVRNEEAMLANIKDPAERMLKLVFSPMFSEVHPDKEDYTSTCLRCELLELVDELVDEVTMTKIRQEYRQRMFPKESK